MNSRWVRVLGDSGAPGHGKGNECNVPEDSGARVRVEVTVLRWLARIMGVTGRALSLLSFLASQEEQLSRASLCDMTDLATEVALTFSIQLFLQIWSQFGDLLLIESADLHGMTAGVCSSWEFCSRLLVVLLVREAKHLRVVNLKDVWRLQYS